MSRAAVVADVHIEPGQGSEELPDRELTREANCLVGNLHLLEDTLYERHFIPSPKERHAGAELIAEPVGQLSKVFFRPTFDCSAGARMYCDTQARSGKQRLQFGDREGVILA